jgi:hypothetical protein
LAPNFQRNNLAEIVIWQAEMLALPPNTFVPEQRVELKNMLLAKQTPCLPDNLRPVIPRHPTLVFL